MGDVAKKIITYDDLYNVPQDMVGEIIEGELITNPRPGGPHALVASSLGIKVGSSFQFGEADGPGGWWIIDEPQLYFEKSPEPLSMVPDIAGWKKEKMPTPPKDYKFNIVPDWVCEIASSSTALYDRRSKMPKYAEFGVNYLWIISPEHKSLEVFKNREGSWLVLSIFGENDKVRAEPFDAVEIDLSYLWMPEDVVNEGGKE